MVNVTCCGGQDRATKASETHPNRPPPDTRNCYHSDGFEYSECDREPSIDNDTGKPKGACFGRGGCNACVADSSGGYCEYGTRDRKNYYISNGSSFYKLSPSELIDRNKENTQKDEIRIRRLMKDSDRKTMNKIRELQIMGRDPIQKRESISSTPVHDGISDILTNLGISAGFTILFITLILYAIKNKIININS